MLIVTKGGQKTEVEKTSYATNKVLDVLNPQRQSIKRKRIPPNAHLSDEFGVNRLSQRLKTLGLLLGKERRKDKQKTELGETGKVSGRISG